MSRKPELDLDLDEKLFENDRECQELQAQMAQLSPRRAVKRGEAEVMTLPFYHEISPSVAIERLFNWFHTSEPEVEDSRTASRNEAVDGDGDGAEEDHEADRRGNDEKAQESMTLEEFNCLRKCIGKPLVNENEWKRALEELGSSSRAVRKVDFKALFGPPPYFGSDNVHGIVKYVMAAEEHIHFAQILVNRFGVDQGQPDPTGTSRVIGLDELRNIQNACFIEPVLGEAEWKELRRKLMVPESRQHLNWKEFAEAFVVSLKGKKVFGSFADPPSVVYAVLANDRLEDTVKEQEEEGGFLSRTAVTNLLRLKGKEEKVDDKIWMQLLEEMQTTYQYRPNASFEGNTRGNADGLDEENVREDAGDDDKAPLVVVRNTKNQVLSYEITFDQNEDTGLTLQSDFFGHCLTVASISGQATKYPIIQTHDIVAMVNETSLTNNVAAPSKEEEDKRVQQAMQLLVDTPVRRITFQRQESYFMYDHEQKTLQLYLKTLEVLPANSIIKIKLPDAESWFPVAYKPGNESECVNVMFVQPDREDLDELPVRWNPSSSSKSIEISLEGAAAIDADFTVIMEISEMDCGSKRMVGPCELVEFDPKTRTLGVTLHAGWKNREAAIRRNPVRAPRTDDDPYDKSSGLIERNFAGDPGITLVGDFFGQCAVVKSVKKSSQASDRRILANDILTAITFVGKSGALETVDCIRPYAPDKDKAETHVNDIKARLKERHKSGKPYRLQFLRLSSHFYHDNGLTIISLVALTTLRGGSALVMRFPTSKWQVNGPLSASVHQSTGIKAKEFISIKVKEIFWDSSHQTVHIILDECSVPELTELTVEIQCLVPGEASKALCAGPGEVIAVHSGDGATVPEIEIRFHEHWNFATQKKLEAAKVFETLKQFDTSPAKLWEVLEYTSLLFDKYKPSDNSDHLKITDLNRLIGIVCGDGKKMNTADWQKLCRDLGADAMIGLTRRQFACCWYDVVGLSSHSAKDTYVRLHTAERLFRELIDIYQEGEQDTQNVLSKETIERVAKFLGFSAEKKRKATRDLDNKGLIGWDSDTFSQIVCGKHPIVTIEDKDAMALWMKLYYAKQLFSTYSTKKIMRKKDMSDLMAAARVKTPKFTNELWMKICESVDVDDINGLRFGDFLEVYTGNLLGSRHPMADWYRIETFKLLPERRVKEEASKEAVMSVAPEKVNVKDIAAKALEETASTEEIFQDLLQQKLEFSKLEKVEDRVIDTFTFKTDFLAKKLSRSTGFLNISIKSITELADNIIQRDSSFNRGKAAEELYVMLQITNSQGLKPRLKDHPKRNTFARAMDKLFGQKNLSNDYDVRGDELWDQGQTQKLMRDMADLEAKLKTTKRRSPEYPGLLAELHALEKRLTPPSQSSGGVPDWRVFSSLVIRDTSPDAIIRFPNDKFRLFVPEHESTDQLYVVCKLFKRIGSEVSRLILQRDAVLALLKKEKETLAILDDLVKQQQEALRHSVADECAKQKDSDKKDVVIDARSAVWNSVAKLRQLRQDVEEMRAKVQRSLEEENTLSMQIEEARKQDELRLADDELIVFPIDTQAGENVGTEANPPKRVSIGGLSKDHPESGPSKRPSMKRLSTVNGKLRSDANTKPTLEGQRVKFIGQAFFELSELLSVLHDDSARTQDLAVFRTETHNDVGVLLLDFEYKCESLQEQSLAVALPTMSIKMAADDAQEQEINETAFEYPSHGHLEISWKSDLLQRNDRICLIREGTKHKVSMPYFLVLWTAVDKNNKPLPLDEGETPERKDAMNKLCDWWIPPVLAKSYSPPRNKLVVTDPSKVSGNLHLPSSIDLSLPPGIYRLYLIRNETDENNNKFRSVLGKSSSLAVLPGVNGVHTSFGTTPLVDIKPISATLQVFPEANRAAVAASLTNREGFRDETYLARIAVSQELAVARADLDALRKEYDNLTAKKKDRSLVEKKIPEIEKVIGELESKREELRSTTTVDDKQVSVAIDPDVSKFTSQQRIVFAFTIEGGTPSPHDRIYVLPADVVRVSDHLRAIILGRLQANDPLQVEKARDAMEEELVEVEQFFNARMSLKTLKKVVWRYIKPFVQTWISSDGPGATNKSASYIAATGAADNAFVWEECMDHYNSASNETKKCFPYIIRDLLDEIGARKSILGLKIPTGTAKTRLGKATSLLKCGAEIAIPPMATTIKEVVSADGFNFVRRVAVGEVSTVLGTQFRKGGFFVAKYVRRASGGGDSGGDGNSMDETAGELCRYGPFYVERALFSYSPVQVALFVGKLIYKALMSDQGKLFLKFLSQFYLSLAKYFLAVVSLSFNINVLAGNFKIDIHHLKELLHKFKARLASYFGPVEILLSTIYDFFSGYIQELLDKLDVFYVAGECMTGFFLFAVLGMLFAATFVVYVVVQEDLLRKVQKLPTYLPINPGKTMLGLLEQGGALLVIPLYLTIKSCVLFISGNWSDFFHKIHDHPSLTMKAFNLTQTATPMCPNASLAKINYGFGFAALILIVFFLFVCLPLLLLDLFSWVPLSELEKPEKLKVLAKSYNRLDIKAAVHSNANLIEFHPVDALRLKTAGCLSKLTTCCSCCSRKGTSRCYSKSNCCSKSWFQNPLFAGFVQHYDDYTKMAFGSLMQKYGAIGFFLMFINVYIHLMLQSIGRALSVFLGWRLRADHMYPNKRMKSNSPWKLFDVFCLRFNLSWKIQYFKDKMIMPFVNICMVTLGLWGESQWKEFNVEERANDCYRMEPSGEIKQLQMMSLHGKIVSLFWLCIPETMVLAYLAEVLNRGPVFSYFLNNQFLQADIPESEREKDPVWRFHSVLAFKGEDDVVYLSDTRFMSTLLKWGSSIVEIISLLMVYAPSFAQNRSILFGITLISAVVTPVLELNQQLIQAYMDYTETAEKLAKSTGMDEIFQKLNCIADTAKETAEDLPEVDVNTRGVVGWIRAKLKPEAKPQQTSPKTATGVSGTDPNASANAGNGNGPSGTVTASVTAKAVAGADAILASPSGGVIRVGGHDNRDDERDKYEDIHNDGEEEDNKSESDDDDDDDDDDNAGEDGEDNTALASLVAASGLVKPTKQLIQLNAMPQVSYVVTTNGLEVGEGELTISWQVNARQRFHALDAIGMFPARAPGDTTIRTMEDCICYRLLKHRNVQEFGWNPKNEDEDAERKLIILQAKSIRDVVERDLKEIKMSRQPMVDDEDAEEEAKAREKEHTLRLESASSTIEDMMEKVKLKPYTKKLPEILEEEIREKKIHETAPRTSRAYSFGAAAREEAAKKMRKIISGQVKFRPANNCVKEDDQQFETFVYGNDAGIYQSKYGLHGFEFCYLRCTEGDGKVVGISSDKETLKKDRGKTQKVTPKESSGSQYEILERFVSNKIQIGTFNIFMNLTCDRPLVGAKETLNLSWIIYGVDYHTLSNPKSRNCIGFYKIDGSHNSTCARIEIIPPSAYLEVDDKEPCPGRMTVTTPNDPGVYEIRFLFNFFKQAQLHRQCQVFGELEDEMQQLRIRSFYEQRSVAEELRKFALREPKVWGVARMNTQAWLTAMLLSTIREPVEESVMESTTDYSKFLVGRLKTKFQQGLKSPLTMYQRRIAQILAPFRLNSFFDVLMVALQSSSQLSDQLASITFISPTEEDERKRGLNRERDMLLLNSDKDLFLYGNVSFRPLAVKYLDQPSLCGYHDFIDDILLNHGQLIQTLDQVMSNLSSSCVHLYETAIADAIKNMKAFADSDEVNLTTALQGVDVMLMDLCRNHIQSMIRAVLETDCRTGLRWTGKPPGSFEKLMALRAGTNLQPDADVDFQVLITKQPYLMGPHRPGAAAPLTREYIALRRWIRPKLERKIVAIMKQRYSRLMDGNWPILLQLVASCRRPGLALAGNPFPDHRKMKTESPVYFLEESRNKQDDPTAKVTKDGETPEDKEDDSLKDKNQEDTNGNNNNNNNDDDEDDIRKNEEHDNQNNQDDDDDKYGVTNDLAQGLGDFAGSS